MVNSPSMSQQPVIPFFKTHTSIGKSLLRIKDVFRLAQENKLALVTLIEDSMIGFPEALRLSKKTGIKLVFGIRFDVCNDLSDPKEKIENSRSKMIAIMRNDEGYKDLISLYSEVHTNEYDCTDYKNLAHYFTDCQDTLLFGLPFYDSFIAKNSLTTSDCLPQFGGYKPFLCVEENGHPFDNIIKARLTHYQYIHGNRVQPCKSIYYENYQDFDAYTTYRLICGRSVYGNASLDRPNLPYFFSNRFCFEDWKNNTYQEVETYARFEDSSIKGKKLVVFDTETEGLNLHSSKPWQIAWVEMLNGKVVNKEMHYLAWDDINVSKEAAAVTGFDINVYNAKKEDPKLIIEKFWKLISDPNVVVVGQNVLGFDIFMLEEVRRLVGLPTDFSYLSRVCDTVSLSRAYLCGIAKSPEESMVEFCFKMLNYKPEKRISVKLNKMLAHFGIDYDESKLHDALVDTEMTAELALRLLRVLGFEENLPFSLSVSSVKTPECTPIFRDIERYETPMLEGVILPTADIPAEEAEALGLPSTCTSLEFLRALCNDGFKRIGIDQYPNFDDYKKRLDYELQVLDACGFVDYMLLNREIIQHCKQVGIPTGKGRGSAAGSLVFYLLDVTRVDPLKYGLIFERFVSMARAKKIQGKDGRTYLDGGLLADCDLDISYADRPKVVDFVFERFNGNACKILTVGTLSGKLCIKECMKLVGGFAEEDTKPVSDMIPKQYGVVKPLKEAYESSEDFKKFCDDNRKVFDIALRLEDLNKNTGVHPSGIAISAFPLKETMPLQLTKDGDLVSSFEMADVASIMVKFDLLGLRTLTQIKATCDMLGMDYTKLDYTNPEIYKFINKDIIPKGIFQIEADTNLKVAMAVKPENLEELSDVVALARPGTLAYLGDYVKAKETGEMRHSGDEGMDSLLHETKGLLLFQETLMMISHKVFGFTLEESEALRKCVSGDTRFYSKNRGWVSVKSLLENGYKDEEFLVAHIGTGERLWKPIQDIWSKGIQRVVRIKLVDLVGLDIKTTETHKFYTSEGWVEAKDLPNREVCFLNRDGNLSFSKVESIEDAGEEEVYDFTVDEETPYIIAEGMVIHNCVGKKQVDKMPAFESKIMEGAEKNGVSKEAALYFWQVCQESANYSFNKCLGLDTYVESQTRGTIKISQVEEGEFIKAYDTKNDCDHFVKVVGIYRSKSKKLYDFSLGGGKIVIRSSMEHKYLTNRGMTPVRFELGKGEVKTKYGFLSIDDATNEREEESIDLEVAHEDHNFYCNGVVVSNSHSLCYAATAAETVYLKYWFPKEFYCSLLEQATAEPDPFAEIEKITQELPNFGIRLLPPDLANSELAFSIEGNDIRYGLGSIKGVSSQTFQKIVNFRNETQRDICDIYTSAKRAGLSIGVLSSFAQAGLFDSFLNGKRRCYLVYMLQTINAITPRQREAVFAIYKYRHQTDPNVDLMQIILECAKNGSVDSNGRILFRGGIEPVQGKIFKFRAIYDQNSKMPDFADWFYEKKVLGYSYSQSVKDLFEEDNARLIDSIEFQQLPNNAKVKVVGWVGEEISEGKSRKTNSKYWRFSINDDNGNITCLMMDVKTRAYTRESLTKYLNEGGKKPSKGNIISIVGSKSNDVIFVNSLAIVEEKIYTRFSELKDEDASKP